MQAALGLAGKFRDGTHGYSLRRVADVSSFPARRLRMGSLASPQRETPAPMRYHYSLKANETVGPVEMIELTRLAAAGKPILDLTHIPR